MLLWVALVRPWRVSLAFHGRPVAMVTDMEPQSCLLMVHHGAGERKARRRGSQGRGTIVLKDTGLIL